MYWIGLRPGDVHLNISSPGWAKHAWSCFFVPWNAGACVFVETNVAGEAEAALSMLRVDADRYDLVITDQTMPRMSGLQLAEAIGRMSAAPPVVLYTGYAEALDPAELSAAGVKGIVHEPFEPGELRAVITRCLGRDRRGSS